MKFPILAIAVTALAAWTTATPIPQASPGVTRRQTTGLTALVGDIMTSDPSPPDAYATQTAHINSIASMMPAEYQKTRSLGSWWHKTWDKIRNAISHIKINVKIPWDVLMQWVDKLAQYWTVMTNPNDPQDVMIVPPNGDMSQALHWHAPIPPTPVQPPKECGFATAPGKPVKMCP